MAIALAVFGVAFAAFCVWLTVRIVNRRERWARRTGIVMSLVVALYPPSIGPSWWLIHQTWCPEWLQNAFSRIYFPIILLFDNAPLTIRNAMESYAALWWWQ
jgi:hypothetical protein